MLAHTWCTIWIKLSSLQSHRYMALHGAAVWRRRARRGREGHAMRRHGGGPTLATRLLTFTRPLHTNAMRLAIGSMRRRRRHQPCIWHPGAAGADARTCCSRPALGGRPPKEGGRSRLGPQGCSIGAAMGPSIRTYTHTPHTSLPPFLHRQWAARHTTATHTVRFAVQHMRRRRPQARAQARAQAGPDTSSQTGPRGTGS